MTSVKEIRGRALQLLWDGKPDEARQLIESERHALRRVLDELDSLLPDHQRQDEPRMRVLGAGTFAAKKPAEFSDDEREARKQKVLAVAKEHEKQAVGKVVSVRYLQRLLDEEGFDLGVQHNRKATAISNILRHSGQYKKVGVGRFRPVSH